MSPATCEVILLDVVFIDQVNHGVAALEVLGDLLGLTRAREVMAEGTFFVGHLWSVLGGLGHAENFFSYCVGT